MLTILTMANPCSLAWALEMYGYGIFGVASFFAAPLFDGPGRQHAIRVLLALNGVMSALC